MHCQLLKYKISDSGQGAVIKSKVNGLFLCWHAPAKRRIKTRNDSDEVIEICHKVKIRSKF